MENKIQKINEENAFKEINEGWTYGTLVSTEDIRQNMYKKDLFRVKFDSELSFNELRQIQKNFIIFRILFESNELDIVRKNRKYND